MSCEATRRHLLNAERPDRPPAAVRPHLAECPACRAWLRNLVEVESQVPLLPVPPSDAARERLLERLREPLPVPATLRVVVPELPFVPPKERGLRKLSVALALAAAVVLFAVGLSVWPRHGEGHEEKVVKVDQVKWLTQLRERRLANVHAPQERVDKLAEFADDLLREVRQSDALPGADRLEQLAKVYEETVREELLANARAVPAIDRKTLLPRLAGELSRTESEFERIAAAAPELSAISLRRIAAAAREGDRELRQIARDSSV